MPPRTQTRARRTGAIISPAAAPLPAAAAAAAEGPPLPQPAIPAPEEGGRRSSRLHGASPAVAAAASPASSSSPSAAAAGRSLSPLQSLPPPAKRRRSELDQQQQQQQQPPDGVETDTLTAHRQTDEPAVKEEAAAALAAAAGAGAAAAVKEESKEAQSPHAPAAPAAPASSLASLRAPQSTSARLSRLASVALPSAPAAAAAAAAASRPARQLRLRDGVQLVASVDLTQTSPRVAPVRNSPRTAPISAPDASALAQTGRRLVRKVQTAAGAQQQQQQSERSTRTRRQSRSSYAEHDSMSDEVEEEEGEESASGRRSAAPRNSNARASRSTVSQSSRALRMERVRAQAEEVGVPLHEFLQMRGEEVDHSLLPAESAEEDAAAAATPAASEKEGHEMEDDESVAPQRRGSRKRRIQEDNSGEESAFQPEGGDDDQRASDSSAEEEEDEEEEDDEEEQQGRYPTRRKVTPPVRFGDEQAREVARRSSRHRHSSEDERHVTNERVVISYERPIAKQQMHRLSDGRVVTDREWRFIQRSGEQVRVLREGEEVDPLGASPDGDAHHASDHHGDVRRSMRHRQQVQHFTVGGGGKSGEDSNDEKPRYAKARGRGGPARRQSRPGRHRRPVAYGDSSTSSPSSSSDSSASEGKKRRRARKEREGIQPLHLQIQHQMRRMEQEASALAGRAFGGSGAGAAGASAKTKDGRLADIDPLEIDSSTDWSSIGGLDAHVHALKEMVVLPLLYPELFQNFHLQPPKGVLFFGPPGTGKTLVARALANTCSATGQKVSFFMRKGADCLSKWVGEAERQLRLLFEQAHKMQPSIIFFDEIDGLAPVRSSRQDQIHASIVSTLLALMDGLDNRGQVIVIGATNRPDSLDPALRRPGRFDRELMFSLPNKVARRQILAIHTRQWEPPLAPAFLNAIADQCVGYCGADIKALCTESTLRAVRRRYPQIYASTEKLAIDVKSIKLKQIDFIEAMRSIVPAAQRSAHVWARSIPAHLAPLLQSSLDQIIAMVQHIFPLGALNRSAQANASYIIAAEVEEEDEQMLLPPDAAAVAHATPAGTTLEVAPTPFPLHTAAAAVSSTAAATSAAPSASPSPSPSPSPSSSARATLPPRPTLPLPLKPRFLLHGSSASMGQSHLGPALLHHFAEYPIFSLDLPMLLGDPHSKNAEEACVRVVGECKRNAPAILYWPHIDLWWSTASESLQHTTLMLLADLPPTASIFLVATADCFHEDLPPPLLSLFPLSSPSSSASATASARVAAPPSTSSTLSFELQRPTLEQLAAFLRPIVEELRRDIPRMRQMSQLEQLPVLPKASQVPSAAISALATASSAALTPEQQVAAESSLTPAQLSQKLTHENSLIRLQRMSLRGITQKLMRSFDGFAHRLDPELYPDYVEVVAEVLALEDILHSVNEQESFDSVGKFNLKIDLLVNNTKEYSAHHEGKYRAWVNEACHMQDVALSMVSQLDTKLVQQCEEISKRRAVRRAKQSASTDSGSSAPPTRANLRSRGKAEDISALDDGATAWPSRASSTVPAAAAAPLGSNDAAMADAASSSSKVALPSPAAALPSASPTAAAAADALSSMGAPQTSLSADVASADAVTRMDVDGEEKAVKQEEGGQVAPSAADAVTSPLASSASPVVPAVTLAAAVAASAATPAPPLASPPASSSPSVSLAPPPPPLQLDSARLAALPAQLADLLLGCSVEQAEQAGFQLIKCAVRYQMKPDRNAAMDEMERVATENRPMAER